jgi:4-hydroxy-2-oxovalerate aldolase
MIRLLDTTLRDGSYIVDFQFTTADTAIIGGALDANGVHLIEVGHGIGLGAHRDPRHGAAATDAEYAAAAAGAIRRAQWGMFCIPGIATLDDLDRAADTGMSFVRIGTDVTQTSSAVPFLERARARGMFVFANFMKTYALGAEDVAQRARALQDAGAQVACVVDSAGSMLPEDVARYVATLRDQLDIEVGFHGHDNLGLAVANTLTAVEHGATIIDTSLRGMGRSAGNACTERTLFALLRRGIDVGVDPVALLAVAEQRIDPLLERAARDTSMGIVSGFAQFHSSFQPIVDDVAQARGVDRCDLVIAVTAADKVNAPRPLVERAADALATAGTRRTRVMVTRQPREDAPSDASFDAAVQRIATRVHSAARRLGRRSVLNLVQQIRPDAGTVLPQTWHEGEIAVVATITVADAADAARIVSLVDGIVDELLVDVDAHTPHGGWLDAVVQPTRSGLLRYSDLSAWSGAVLDVIMSFGSHRGPRGAVTVAGDPAAPLTSAISALATARGLQLTAATRDGSPSMVILCEPPAVQRAFAFDPGVPPAVVIDAWIGALDRDTHEALQRAGTQVLRPDMRAALQAEILRATDARQRATRTAGLAVYEGIPLVSGGVLAPRGTIVVDSVVSPRVVHGVADGRGALINAHDLDVETMDRLRRAEDVLLYSVG